MTSSQQLRTFGAALASAILASCGSLPTMAGPASSATEARSAAGASFNDAPPSYREALRIWRSAEDVNAWLGAKFEYDFSRAVQLSETQRRKAGRVPILAPEEFYPAPTGVCLDVARFAVETLRSIDPEARASYVMIEFDPVEIDGNVLRRHWIAAFERDGMRYFFADSWRPGHIAGPYATTQAFMAEYARYRGRGIVSFSERASFEREARAIAHRQSRPRIGSSELASQRRD